MKDYGGYKNKMNPLGVNVSDVWTDIYPVRHKRDKNRKYNELSVKLLNRQWVGCELGDCEIIKQRLIHSKRDKEQLKRIQEESGCLVYTCDK